MPHKHGYVEWARTRTPEVNKCVDYPGVHRILEHRRRDLGVTQKGSEEGLFLIGHERQEISRQVGSYVRPAGHAEVRA
jgi:hypothetical protein